MRPDFNARRAERAQRATELANAAEQLLAQARATMAEWDARIREQSRAPVAGAEPSVPAGPSELYEQLERELADLEEEAEATRRLLEEEKKAAGDWELRAIIAVREGRDDLARIALKRQQEHSESYEALRDELWVVKAVIEESRARVRARRSDDPI